MNVTAGGSGPVSDNVELGTPVVVTVKVPAWPTVKVVPAELVIPGAWRTERMKGSVAGGLTPFVAVIVNGYAPPEPAPGVPASVAVPSPLSVNVTPGGSAPVSDNAQLGTPVVVTLKVPACPTVKVAWWALVIAHACAGSTVRVKVWVASGPATVVGGDRDRDVPGAVGVPENVPVASRCVNASPGGRPVSDHAHVGPPVDVGVDATVEGQGNPAGRVVVGGTLVISHAWSTVRMKLWVL